MAATVALLGTPTFNTTAGNKTVTATPTAGDLIVIIAAATGSLGTTAVTDNQSGTYTKVENRSGFSTSGLVNIWVRDALIPASSSTIFTATQGSTTGGGLVVLRLTGVSAVGAAAVRSFGGQSSGTSGTTPAPVLNLTPVSANPIITAVANGTNSTSTLVPRTGYTEVFDNGYSTPATGLEVAYRASGETSATLTQGGNSASAFASVAIEVLADALSTVTTQAATSITGTSVTGNGNITNAGSPAPTTRGFCYMVGNGTPGLSDLVASDSGTYGTGAFTKSITGLSQGTLYSMRAFATNSVGTAFGSVVTFTTTGEPTTVLNTPTDTATGISVNPTLNFTGTDPEGDNVEYEVQVDTVNTFDSIRSPAIIDSYSETNQSSDYPVISSTTSIGQSFTGNGDTLGSVKVYLKQFSGAVSGNMIAKIYAETHSTAFGTDSIPTGSPLATSDNYAGSNIGSSYALHTLTFSGGNQIALSNGTKYVITIENSIVSGFNAGYDTSSPTHSGNLTRFSLGSWISDSSSDFCFYVYNNNSSLPLLDKFSTTDPGFTAGHPFTSGVAKDYTVQGEAVDQSQSSSSASFGFGEFANVRYRGQVFQLNKSGKLSKIGFDRNKGSQGVKVYFDTVDSSNLPTHSAGSELYSFVIPNASITNGYAEYSLPVPFAVNAGVKYCFYLAPWSSGGSYTDDYQDCHGISSVSGGVIEITMDTGVWITENLTFHYAIYVDETLAASTTYYWRVRATDPAGTNTYGAWATARSFTTASGSSIKTFDALAKASIKTINGLAIASVKTIDGLT